MFSGTSVPGARTLRISSPRRTESIMTSARATEGGRASSLLSATVSATAATTPPAMRTFRFVFLGGSLLISTGTFSSGSLFDTYYGWTVEKLQAFQGIQRGSQQCSRLVLLPSRAKGRGQESKGQGQDEGNGERAEGLGLSVARN